MAAPDAIGVGSAVAVAARVGIAVGERVAVATAAVGVDVATIVGVGSTRVAVPATGEAVSGPGLPEQAAIAITSAGKQIDET